MAKKKIVKKSRLNKATKPKTVKNKTKKTAPKENPKLDTSMFLETTNVKVDSYDLNEFISAAYKLEKSFECQLESPNDSTHEFHVSDIEPSEHDVKSVKKMLEQGHCAIYFTGKILNDLCHKKIIKPGDYLVSVSW